MHLWTISPSTCWEWGSSSILLTCRHSSCPCQLYQQPHRLQPTKKSRPAPGWNWRKKQWLQSSRSRQSDVQEWTRIFIQWPQRHQRHLVHHRPQQGRSMAMGLAQFYKYASNREKKIFLPRSRRIDLLHHYLAVENLRFGNALHTQIEMHEGLDQVLIPYMMFTTLAENAIKKYGFNTANQTVSLLQLPYALGINCTLVFIDEGKPLMKPSSTALAYSLNRKLNCCTMEPSCFNLSIHQRNVFFTTSLKDCTMINALIVDDEEPLPT